MAVRINGARDMAKVEGEIGRIMGCQNRKCSLVHSYDFVSLRLCALYGRGGKKAPLTVYRENIQISLDDNQTITVYLLTSDVAPIDEVVASGKKRELEEVHELGLLADSE